VEGMKGVGRDGEESKLREHTAKLCYCNRKKEQLIYNQ
jgi:hypothetical protein